MSAGCFRKLMVNKKLQEIFKLLENYKVVQILTLILKMKIQKGTLFRGVKRAHFDSPASRL